MRIFIAGGTGLIGSALIPVLHKKGHEITVLTRNVAKAEKKLGNMARFCASLEAKSSLDKYDAVINLAGESIAGKKWTKKRKHSLCESRWSVTYKLSELILGGKMPPKVYISGSAIGYYGAQNDVILTEDSVPKDEFTYQLCKKWEDLAMYAICDDTRVCLLRTGIVLSSKGGMLRKISLPFKCGLGAVLGNGKQYISWIHIEDMVDAIVYLLENREARGAFNMTSPTPVTNRCFSKALAHVLHRPCFLRIPAFIVKMVLGEMSTLVIDGQRAIPLKLLEIGFKFKFLEVSKAFENIFKEKS